MALEVLSLGWRLAFEVIPEVEEKLICSIKAETLLHYAHRALFCPKKLTVSESTFIGLKMALEVLSGFEDWHWMSFQSWRQTNWFHRGWILTTVCSPGFSLPIEANCLWKYTWGLSMALEVLSLGWRLALEVIPEIEEVSLVQKVLILVRYWLLDGFKF